MLQNKFETHVIQVCFKGIYLPRVYELILFPDIIRIKF